MRALPLPLLLLGLWLSGPLHAASEAAPLPGGFQPVGSGNLTFFGMTVYRATLLAPGGVYHPERPHALQIDYRFSFSGERLATSSVDEMIKLSPRPLDRPRLIRELAELLPDVKRGDRITGLHRPGEGMLFFSGERYLGRLADAAAAADFFAIWLHPRSPRPGLRARLLGGQR